jgi:phosphoglycolate phosphatase
MTATVRAVVFDLDGTLVDSRADLAASANYALTTLGFAAHSEQAIGSFVGDGARNLISRAAGISENHPEFDALLAAFVEHYDRHCAVKTKLMPGALEAMTALVELPLAVLTNKPRQPTLTLLAALGQLDRFSVIVAGGDLPYLKPDPRPLEHVAKCLKLPVSQLVLVGDGPQDVECGRTAGAKTIGVKGGIAALERLIFAAPDRLIDSLYDLPKAVASLNTTESLPL